MREAQYLVSLLQIIHTFVRSENELRKSRIIRHRSIRNGNIKPAFPRAEVRCKGGEIECSFMKEATVEVVLLLEQALNGCQGSLTRMKTTAHVGHLQRQIDTE